MRSVRKIIYPVVLFVFAAGCQSGNDGAKALLVGSAISLRPVLDSAIASFTRQHPEAEITVTYAGSGTIRQQILYGAPIDLYLSASPEHVDSLAEQALIDTSTRSVLASNRLMLIMSVQRTPIGGLKDLLLPSISRIAIGEPNIVPAGRYAMQSLNHTGLLPAVQEKLLFTKDVQQVLVYVRTGSVDVGIVYASDVQASTPVRVVETISDTLHERIVYEGAITAHSTSREAAAAFLAYLQSDSVRSLFRSHAFQTVTP